MTEARPLYGVSARVADVDRAAGFSERLFGGAGRRIEGASRHYFDCGDVILALLQPRGETARSTPDYLYFAVGDLEAVHRRAKDLGALAKGTIHGESAAGEIARRPWGGRSFYAPDPFGNLLCFVAARTLFTGP